MTCSCNELQTSGGTLNSLLDDQIDYINSSRNCVSPICSVFFVSEILQPIRGSDYDPCCSQKPR